ncbi:MAG: endonuclease III domain-containing protein, partial [Chloroflexota bacterium]|nr:endonuclease III domain-containing protein [Chloroflexota bacterium]
MGSKATDTSSDLIDIYERLLGRYGPQRWWPAESPFEVIIGAILTQSTAWTNVEKAIGNLKSADVLDPVALDAIPIDDLARLIRPSGYYNAKATKVKAFVERLNREHGGDLDRLFAIDTTSLRKELLSIHGIGDETADSILLYAAHRPIFVIDAYTKRIIDRLGLAPSSDSYHAFQLLFMDNLSRDEGMFNEYHALFVRHGKEVCRKSPKCDVCCLASLPKKRCPFAEGPGDLGVDQG